MVINVWQLYTLCAIYFKSIRVETCGVPHQNMVVMVDVASQ